MARIGGRSLWLAIPAGLLCAAIVGALAWLAMPMVPLAAAWVGQMVTAATNLPRPAPPPETVASMATTQDDIDCRTLYSDSLWAELTWTPDVLLSQTYAAPATAVTGLTDALTPAVIVTCAWRADDGRIVVSTLARVGADAAPVADAALRGQGFECAIDTDGLDCRRESGDVVEEHVLRGDLWLSTVETGWHPEDYASRLAARIWG